ncbi:rhodanese-like domain-containing protein [Winogradskyella sp. DF17]|uniref:Rhodanese-like domain-containing protein n=1 Tax=Winogradskyella pelagia TaxID=2819984 RepID=A0ABS3T0W2_9FLAO|nr:rhodanese-like domain-containing protein [Winogradskyella sp. DF17]MBO3116384.1 rhodanese-like domain-containing protein [Winogradskyella sp. DF17]
MSFFSSLFGPKKSKSTAITLLSPEEFREKVNQGDIQIVDVRTPSEYKSGHIKNAQNIDFFSGKFNVEFNKLDMAKPIYLYCRSGNRSRQTAKKLENIGFTEIYDLKGGILNYK